MMIVIDIDEEDYEHIKEYAHEEVLPVGWREIVNGTPLIECNNRLVNDAIEIIDEIREEMNNGDKL